MVVRDEARFLRENLAYHRYMGVDRIYLFLDRCTDETPIIAADFDHAVTLDRPRRDDEAYMSTFQTRCLNEALEIARTDGYDWLLHLDADEFARPPRPRNFVFCFGKRNGLGPLSDANRLPKMLRDVPDEIEQVTLRPLDVLPTPRPIGSPFYEHQYFQNRGAMRRDILDPTCDEVIRYDKRLGHYHGKSIVRVSDRVEAGNAHFWARRGGGKLPSVKRGLLYHYIAVDGELWLTKHRKFAEYPAHWEKGNPVRFPKQAWKEASLAMSLEEARAYFDRWIALPESRLRRACWTGAVVSDPFVKQVIEMTQKSDPSSCVSPPQV
jgi:hypothetical protein